ncbi:hypothetical protein EW146_g5354 [Bondarzewia mesenterica]|uniref:Uncharacterized protein n=1 Tax=Bondarzewia mesenterica TaxID=1095465 RepID=A0A4V3XEV4_9AGAM|nr:hypothetical protein EW146_g5354 [Bondarzewia mesenterica]
MLVRDFKVDENFSGWQATSSNFKLVSGNLEISQIVVIPKMPGPVTLTFMRTEHSLADAGPPLEVSEVPREHKLIKQEPDLSGSGAESLTFGAAAAPATSTSGSEIKGSETKLLHGSSGTKGMYFDDDFNLIFPPPPYRRCHRRTGLAIQDGTEGAEDAS